jgi:hypothetical protein
MLFEDDRFHPNNTEDMVNPKEILKKSNVPTMYLEPIKKFECFLPCQVGSKKKQIKAYRSVAYIRNAVTGIQYDDLVGSKNEHRYFKVSFPPDLGVFFFENPDEFERHFYVKVNDATRNSWLGGRSPP